MPTKDTVIGGGFNPGFLFKSEESFDVFSGSPAPPIQFRKPGYPGYRNLLFLTDLLTNRIAQINTNHHKHTQPTVWNGDATHFKIQLSRFRNWPAEAVAV